MLNSAANFFNSISVAMLIVWAYEQMTRILCRKAYEDGLKDGAAVSSDKQEGK